VRERVSLAEMMDRVVRTVRRGGKSSFFALCDGLDRSGIIVTFLALLELVRRERVRIVQAESFADIEIVLVDADRAA
jgi:segregation and condensation protein A